MATQIAPGELAEYRKISGSGRQTEARPTALGRGALWLTLAFGLIAAVASLGTLVLDVLRAQLL